MSAIELSVFLIVVACVGINLAVDRSGDDVEASTSSRVTRRAGRGAAPRE